MGGGNIGDFISTGDTSHDYFPTELDGDPYVATYNNFTVNSGHTVTTTNRCKGMYLKILGDLTINGTLSMTARGAKAVGKYVGISLEHNAIYYNSENTFNTVIPNEKFLIYPVGGLGILNGSNPGINGACGSGGTLSSDINSSWPVQFKSRGGHGTSFSGGAGAGGGCAYSDTISSKYVFAGYSGADNGGAGGNGYRYGGANAAYGGGGGAGNPGGICSYQRSRNGQSGTGGLMILIVHGNVIIGDTGSIQANGSNGGNGELGVSNVRYRSYPGQGSGGGAIHIFHKGSITNTAKITVTGGTGYYPNTGNFGFKAGDGTINIVSIKKYIWPINSQFLRFNNIAPAIKFYKNLLQHKNYM